MFPKTGLVRYLSPSLLLEKQNINNFEKGCEYYGGDKGKLSDGQVLHDCTTVTVISTTDIKEYCCIASSFSETFFN